MPIARRQDDAEISHLRPYIFHGVQLTAHGSHGVGDCPFCGREGKFSAAVDTGLWRCFVCGAGGNALVFVRLLHERSMSASLPAFRRTVAEDRKLVSERTVAAWGVCQSIADRRAWLVPGYGVDGKLDQVYKRIFNNGTWQNLPTPGLWPEGKGHALHMPIGDFDPDRMSVIITEGPWDGMALWEVRPRDGTTNVIAVPGCTTWRDEWTAMCRGKTVVLMFDSDHPRVHGDKTFRAGFDGMVRVAKKLHGVAAAIGWLRWGPDGYDTTKPSGWDVRDYLTSEVV